ncbi:MAG: hypothetical protein FJ211_03115 [Ignavibacteria bacterium]|nr:hypothetical protein [Ignavibacteria bacterium]
MKCIYLRYFSMLIVLVASAQSMLADSSGKTGLSNVGCAGCHGGQAGPANVVLEGPRTVLTGQTKAYAVVVAHNNNQSAGFNAAIKNGNANIGTIQAVTNCKVVGGEVTHANVTQFAGGSARFEFNWTAPNTAGTYTFTGAGNAVNNDGRATDLDDWALTGPIQITVIGGSIMGPTAGSSFCTGQSMSITWTQAGLNTIRLELSKDNFQTTTVVATVAANTLSYNYAISASFEQGTYALRMVDVASDEVVSTVQSIVINAGPAITLQPKPTFVCAGKPLNLSVSATGTGLQYRWRKNGVDIAGGTKPVLTINTVTTAEAGTYDCVIFGCNTNVTSDAVLVTIGVKPAITTQPSSVTVCEGGKVSFTVAATGTDLTYTWKRNNGIVSGGTEPKLTIDAATLLDEGDYTCTVEGACSPAAVSAVAKLLVTEKPAIRTQPVDRSLKEGDTLSLAVVASGELLTYQWYKDGEPLSSQKAATLRKTAIVKADSGVYKCVVFNNCDTVESKTAIVRITSVSGPGKFVLSLPSLTFEEVPACSVIDTVVSGLLVNEGGSPVTITSISAEPIANIEVVGLVAPFALAVNERRDVRIRITPRVIGPIDASIQFFASSGNQTLKVQGDAVSGLKFMQDTLVFPDGTANVKKCNLSASLPCATARITRISVSGAGRDTWKIVSEPQLPLTLKQGEQLELCFESIAANGESASVVVTSDVGTSAFRLARGTISSVDEVEATSQVNVFPNPMTDDLFIRGRQDEMLACDIMTVSGSTIASLRGLGEIVWSRRDAKGDAVASGLYLVVVTNNSGRSIHKVIVR